VLMHLIIIFQYSNYIQTYVHPFWVLEHVDQNRIINVEIGVRLI
jgi:hypothetical protein